MTAALLKKQLLEVFSFILMDRRRGGRRYGMNLLLYTGIYVMLFVSLSMAFFTYADMLCEPLVSIGMGWLYFALMGLMALTLSVVGSAFASYSSLYNARDNDMLFSMPIPPKTILNVRLFGVYFLAVIYGLPVMIPASAVYLANAGAGALSAAFLVLLPFVLGFLSLAISCILGWVIALISAKMKNMKMLTVVFSLVFVAAYMYLYYNVYGMIGSILADPVSLGNTVRGFLIPFHHFGLAAEGSVLSMLVFLLICGVIFAAVYYVLSSSYLKLNIAASAKQKKKYREKKSKALSPSSAFLIKEFRRFTGSANYMLNCGMGVIFMLIGAVLLPIKGKEIGSIAAELTSVIGPDADVMVLIIAAAVCMMAGMVDITAPSVSLEGKNLWISQVMPVNADVVLFAKIKLHFIIASIPAVFLGISCVFVFDTGITAALLMLLTVVAFILFCACFGLILNLRFPNLNWSTEVVPIKQSMSVFISMMGSWVLVLVLGFLYTVIMTSVSPLLYMALCSAFLILADVIMLKWIGTKGAGLYSEL